MVGFALATFFLLHGLVFAFHSFVIFRYQTLYSQVQANGAAIQMPENFLRVQESAQYRSFFSRPDVLAEEIGVLQAGTRSMIYQYKNDIYRLHDTIVQHIKYLIVASEVGQELIYPGQARSLEHANMLQKRLELAPPGDINTLIDISTLSKSLVETTQKNIEYAQKKLIFQDILAFKHEMLLLIDMYRLNPPKEKMIDTKKFWKEFSTLFSREKLTTETSEVLRNSLEQLKFSTQKYRDAATEIRTKNRDRRASWVATEQEKWNKLALLPPTSPLPDIYQLVYVSLAKQMMYVYEDNELILSTSITSGRNNYETIRGTFRIYTKQRGKTMKSPFPDEEYELWVDYWM